MSQSPSSHARFCQPVRFSSTRTYSGLFQRLSVTRAGIKRVSVSRFSLNGTMNFDRYHPCPTPPGLVVEYIRGRKFGLLLRQQVEMSWYFLAVRVVASSMPITSY